LNAALRTVSPGGDKLAAGCQTYLLCVISHGGRELESRGEPRENLKHCNQKRAEMEQMTDAMGGPLDLNPAGVNRGGPQIDSILSQLAALFQRTEADLSYVSRKLQTEFSSAYSSVGAQTVRDSSHAEGMGYSREVATSLRGTHVPRSPNLHSDLLLWVLRLSEARAAVL